MDILTTPKREAVLTFRLYRLLVTPVLERPKQGNNGNGDNQSNDVERKSNAHKVGKLIIAHTLHNQVCLITNRRAKTR